MIAYLCNLLWKNGHFPIFQTAGRAVLSAGIALLLLSCVQPVDLKGFVDHMPDPPMGMDIDYEVSDESPKLQLSNDQEWWKALEREGEVTINLNASPPNTVTIQVMDMSSFDSIDWYCESIIALTDKQGVRRSSNDTKSYDWLVITPGTAPFTDAKIYQMVVVGTKDGQKFGTSVSIRVVGNSL